MQRLRPVKLNIYYSTLLRIIRFLLLFACRSKLSILIYHRVLDKTDPLRLGLPTKFEFSTQISTLAKYFNVLPLDVAVEKLKHGQLPRRAACITFDDGYADNFKIALPILKRWEVPATFFISTGFLDGGCMWNDILAESINRASKEVIDLHHFGLGLCSIKTVAEKRLILEALINAHKHNHPTQRDQEVRDFAEKMSVEIPTTFMMTSAQVRQLHAMGMSLGAHTVSHPILAALRSGEARSEISDGKAILEGITGSPVCYFAYPNGKPGEDYLSEHVDFVKRLGFLGAVSTSPGSANAHSDVFQLPRFTPWDIQPHRFLLRMMLNACFAKEKGVSSDLKT